MFQTTDERTLRLGLMAMAHGHVSRDQLTQVFEDLSQNPLRTLSSLLRERGLITETELVWLESSVDDPAVLPPEEFTFVKSAVQSGRRLEDALKLIPDQALQSVRSRIGEVTQFSPETSVANPPVEDDDPFATMASLSKAPQPPASPPGQSSVLASPVDDFPTDADATAEFSVPPAFNDASTLPLQPGEDPYATAQSLPLADEAELYETRLDGPTIGPEATAAARGHSSGGLSEAFPALGGNRPEDPFATVADADLAATGAPESLVATEAIPLSGSASARSHPGQEIPAGIGRAFSGLAPQVSRFDIIASHAQGGLGEVFRATDRELNRLVALKEIKSRYASHPDSQARFKYEAEVTGGLEHPGIVPVYGMNEYPDGRPYYAMRFIQGETLKHAIKEFYKGDEPKTAAERSLATVKFHELIRCIINVCYALEYAHKRKVLHRDIKPDNIMIGPYGETLVVDWGLAKIIGAGEPGDADLPPLRPMSGGTSSTEVGTTVGTPAFMSPEQAGGDNDNLGPTTDIYSLGSTLYQIVVGRTPIQANNIIELLNKVRNGDFPRPRAVKPGVHPALEAICLKAMALNVADRYQSCRDLAKDLERWLADEPVSVYEEPWQVKLGRWARRHRTAVASVFVLLATGLAATAVGYVLVNRERARTEQNYQLARSAVEQMLTEVGDVELADVPQMEGVRRKLLNRAKAFYDKFLEERKDDPKLKTDTGRAHARLGDIQEMLGLYDQAEPSYKEAVTLLGAPSSGSTSDLDRRRALGRTLTRLGILLRKSNRFVEAEKAFRESLDLCSAVAAAPGASPEDQRIYADLRYQLGALLAKQSGRSGEDEELYQEALQTQTDLAAKDAGNLTLRAERARSLNNLGILQKSSGRMKEAEASWDEALRIMRGLTAAEAGVAGHRWQLARILTNLALLKSVATRSVDTEAMLRESLGLLQTLAAEYPKVPDYSREAAVLLNNVGLLDEYSVPPKLAEAEKDYQQARARQEELSKNFPSIPDHQYRLSLTELHLAGLNAPTKPAEAEALYRKVAERMSKLMERYPTVPEYRSTVGLADYGLGLLIGQTQGLAGTAPALDLLVKAADIHAEVVKSSPNNPKESDALAADLQAICILLAGQDRPDDLIGYAQRLGSAKPGSHTSVLAASYLAGAAGKAKDLKVAETLGAKAVELLREGMSRGPIPPADMDDPRWKPIADRPDFKKVRDEIRVKGSQRTT